MNSPKLIETTFRNYLVVFKEIPRVQSVDSPIYANVVILGTVVLLISGWAVLLLQNENLAGGQG
jgi:hypothetical protein